MSNDNMTGLPCPHCRVDLVMSERNGVEIDYCPQCRGIWLDRGELDKILERSAVYEAQLRQPVAPSPQTSTGPWGNPAPMSQPPAYAAQPAYHGNSHGHGDDHHGRRKGHHKSFLGRFFD